MEAKVDVYSCNDHLDLYAPPPATMIFSGALERHPGLKLVLAESRERCHVAARQGGRGADASSVYVRDPDGNLVEFMISP